MYASCIDSLVQQTTSRNDGRRRCTQFAEECEKTTNKGVSDHTSVQFTPPI